MQIYCKNQEFENDMIDLLHLFEKHGDDGIEIFHTEKFEGFVCLNSFRVVENGKAQTFVFEKQLPTNISSLQEKSLRKKAVLNHLYEILSKGLSKKLPWGSLTGIRPTKLARDLVDNGFVKSHFITEYLQNEFNVSLAKSMLVSKIIKNQKCIIRNDNLIDFYVNIPICPSRCNYCSFISHEYNKVKDIIDLYIDCLIKEIRAVKKIINEKAFIVRTVYIGGGTPSVLNESQIERLLKEISFPVNEFTFECGRPETVTLEKLQVLKNFNVTRISINPQTFSDSTLKRIGRNHKISDVYNAYSLAMEFGFDVNMDVIIGLDGEGKGHWTRTINTLLELQPDNITLHTLSVKKGSVLAENLNEDDKVEKNAKEWNISASLEEGEEKLMTNGYQPYYLYRQKNQLGGLENIGFCKNDKLCIFNIDSMEETNTIIAVGANAASKRVFNFENRIERSFNNKFINDYIENIDQMIERKQEFFN